MSNDDISVKFANRLKQLREEKNLSQEQLALLCGLDRTYIGRIERLERKPSLVTVEKIANGLNIHILELLKM